MRIGLMAIGDRGWMGGVYYISSLIRAIRLLPSDEQPSLYLICPPTVAAEAYSDVLHLVELLPYALNGKQPKLLSGAKQFVKRLLQSRKITRRLVSRGKWAGMGTPFRNLLPAIKERN